MARNDTSTTDQQSRTAQQKNNQQTEGSQGQSQKTQNTQMMQRQRGAMSPGAGFGPLALPLFAGDLFRMNPFSLMRRLSEEMDRTFGQLSTGQGDGGTAAWAPNVEVREQNGSYVVRADLPGINPDDVRVEVTDDGLLIEGERKREHEEKQGGIRRTEVQYGYFARVIPLPDGANVQQANARFDNGVLEITVPVPQQGTNRREIPVQGSSGSSSSGSQSGSGSSSSGSGSATSGPSNASGSQPRSS